MAFENYRPISDVILQFAQTWPKRKANLAEAYAMGAQRADRRRALDIEQQQLVQAQAKERLGMIGAEIEAAQDPGSVMGLWAEVNDIRQNVFGQPALKPTNDELARFQVRSRAWRGEKEATPSFSKGTGVLVKNPDNSYDMVNSVLNQRTGEMETVRTPVSGQVVDRQFGETGDERTDRVVDEAGRKAAAVEEAEISLIPARAEAQYWADYRGEAPKKIAAANSLLKQVDSVISEVQGARELVSAATTGLIGSQARKIPGTDAYTLDRRITTIKANLGFDKLQDMRNNSPTGGALGQVSERELDLLQSALTALDQATNDEEVLRALSKIEEHYSNWRGVISGQIDADRLLTYQDVNQEQGQQTEQSQPQATVIQYDAQGNRVP